MATGALEVTLDDISSDFAALTVGQSQLDGESSCLPSLEGRGRERGRDRSFQRVLCTGFDGVGT